MTPKEQKQALKKSLGLLLTVLVMLAILLPLCLWVQNRFGQFAMSMTFVFGLAIIFKPIYNFFARKFNYETVEEYLAKK